MANKHGENPWDAAPDTDNMDDGVYLVPPNGTPPGQPPVPSMLAREGKDRHVPTPFILAISSAILFSVVALMGPHRDLFSVGIRLALMSVAVAACAAFASAKASVIIAALGWLFMTAFLVGRYGVLDWRGSSDLLHLLTLTAAALIAANIRARLLAPRTPDGPSRSG